MVSQAVASVDAWLAKAERHPEPTRAGMSPFSVPFVSP